MSNKPANQNAFSAITRGIRVIAQPFYLEEQSVPDRNQYVWAYRIEIINQGDEVVRLETRTWSITDAKGVTQEVHGPGVVGEFPRLAPGETFAYTSGVPLSEPSGMRRTAPLDEIVFGSLRSVCYEIVFGSLRSVCYEIVFGLL
mgnify:CR=1 FL=1